MARSLTTMQFTYRIAEREVAQYLLQRLMRPFQRLRLILIGVALAVGVLCFALALLLASTAITRAAFWILGLAFLIVAAMYGFLFLFGGKRMLRGNPAIYAERTVNFGEDGITTDTEFQHTQTKWTSFVRFEETEFFFVFYQSELQRSIVPRRVFTPDELLAFRKLLARKIPARSAINVTT